MIFPPPASLSDLKRLILNGNRIHDLSALASLTNLVEIGLYGNRITDISPLASLTNLNELRLGWNHISDIQPLVANSGLSDGDAVNLTDNPLSDTSVNVYIPQLQQRGVGVGW